LQRKAGLNFLNTANLKVLTDVALPQNLAQVTAYVKERAGTVVDLQHVFHEITTMLMGRMAYNVSLSLVEPVLRRELLISERTTDGRHACR
jgi:hypothetical protein